MVEQEQSFISLEKIMRRPLVSERAAICSLDSVPFCSLVGRHDMVLPHICHYLCGEVDDSQKFGRPRDPALTQARLSAGA